MEKLIAVARILLGLVFTIFGLDYFLHFMPEPPASEVSEAGTAYLTAVWNTGYMFPLIKIIEIVTGLLLLSGYLVPLALTLLTPVALNIFLYHAFLDANGRVFATAIFVVNLLLIWAYRDYFKGLFEVRARARAVSFTRQPLTEGVAVAEQL
jgi:uncharacterized membrane protein YphA (DoxX/SURF4 family)